MSFKVNWRSLETDDLSSWTKELLTGALNSGERPNILASDISIKDLSFGKDAPNFEILEIGELERDRFRGIFKVSYEGDFSLTLHTKVQANPLNIHHSNSLDREVGLVPFITPDFALSSENFALPLDLKLSDLKINGIGIIVFSQSKGLTLVFKNDPLDSIAVSSTFDTVQVLATFLQNQIEKQIRDLFRETLPTLIHQVSIKYLSVDTVDEMKPAFTKSLETDAADTTMDSFAEYSFQNLHKIMFLYNSRETLALDIPKFKNIFQRSHLDKYNKNSPSLLNALRKSIMERNCSDHTGSLAESAVLAASSTVPSATSNGIPATLLCNQDYDTTNTILSVISHVQSASYYKGSGHGHTHAHGANQAQVQPIIKPRRRKIRLGKTKDTSQTSETPQTITPQTITPPPASPSTPATSPMPQAVPMSSSNSRNMVKKSRPQPSPLAHPRPQLPRDLYHELMRSYHDASPAASHILQHAHSATSVITGVGLGGHLFGFPNSPRVQSPTKNDLVRRSPDELHPEVVRSSRPRSCVGTERMVGVDSGHCLTETAKRTLEGSRLPIDLAPPPYYMS